MIYHKYATVCHNIPRYSGGLSMGPKFLVVAWMLQLQTFASMQMKCVNDPDPAHNHPDGNTYSLVSELKSFIMGAAGEVCGETT